MTLNEEDNIQPIRVNSCTDNYFACGGRDCGICIPASSFRTTLKVSSRIHG
jgi:hypothetical protein